MSAPAAGGSSKWQCKHCHFEIPAVPRDVSIGFCLVCKAVCDVNASPTPDNQMGQDKDAPRGGEIPAAAFISDTSQSPPTTLGSSVDKPFIVGIYPKLPSLEEMDISFGSFTLAQSEENGNATILPQKRQHDCYSDQQQAAQSQKKKCEEGPHTPTCTPPSTPQPPPLPQDSPPRKDSGGDTEGAKRVNETPTPQHSDLNRKELRRHHDDNNKGDKGQPSQEDEDVYHDCDEFKNEAGNNRVSYMYTGLIFRSCHLRLKHEINGYLAQPMNIRVNN